MTGFGRGSADAGERRLRIEIRSVNHRGLDLKIRCTEPDTSATPRSRARCGGAVERGAITVQIRDEAADRAGGVDEARVRRLYAALERLRQELEIDEPVSLSTVGAFMGAAPGGTLAGEALWEVLRPAIEARSASCGRRARARARRWRPICGRARTAVELAASSRAGAAGCRKSSPSASRSGWRPCRGVAGDPGRLAQEVALMAERLDVSEELVRLDTHLEHLGTLLGGRPGGGGRPQARLRAPGGRPRAQHHRLEGPGRRHRRPGHRRQGGTREDPRAGAEYRMTPRMPALGGRRNSAIAAAMIESTPMTDTELGAHRGILLVISSPSGAGKTTLARVLAEQNGSSSRSRTRRGPPRQGERDGVDYKFVTEDEFTRMVERQEFAEWAVVHGTRYGTAVHTVNRALEDGKDYLFDIDWQGGAPDPPAVAGRERAVFILPPSMAELERRLRRRATDSPEAIERRLAMASRELEHFGEYDYLVVNDNLETALKELTSIYVAARCARSRRATWHALLAEARTRGQPQTQ